jgi:AraC-like DNA-binding protein
METYAEQRLVVSGITLGRSQDSVHHIINLLDAAMHQLYRKKKPARRTILKAASLLRNQIDPEVAQATRDTRGGLRSWQARKMRAYIDSHIAGPVLVADLCALIKLSESHFSRAFSRTFGKSPHAFLIRQRVELAAQYMLQTEARAAWRRAHISEDDGKRHRGPPRSPQEKVQSEWYSADGMPAQKEAKRAPVPLERLTAGETDIGSGRTPTLGGDRTEWSCSSTYVRPNA